MKRLAADGMMYKGNRTMRSSFGVIDGVVVLIVITPCPPHQLDNIFASGRQLENCHHDLAVPILVRNHDHVSSNYLIIQII